jgi:hypothetical protein
MVMLLIGSLPNQAWRREAKRPAHDGEAIPI